MDETGLFYHLPPNKTLATRSIPGTKKSKDRITIGLCASIIGTEKLDPIIICKSRNPSTLKG